MKKIKGRSTSGWSNIAGMNAPKLQTSTIYGKPLMRPINKQSADLMTSLNKDVEDVLAKRKNKSKTKGKKIKSKHASIGDLKTKMLAQKRYVCFKCGATIKLDQVPNHQKRCGTGFKGITISTNVQKKVKTNKPVNIEDKFNQLLNKCKPRKKLTKLPPPPLISPNKQARK